MGEGGHGTAREAALTLAVLGLAALALLALLVVGVRILDQIP